MKYPKIGKILKKFKTEIYIIFSIVSYSLIRDALSGDVVYSDRFLSWGIQGFIAPVFYIYVLERNNIDLLHVLNILIPVAALLTLLFFFFPSLDYWYVSNSNDPVFELYESFEIRYRAYGFAEHLNSTYSFVLGIWAAVYLSKFLTEFKLLHIVIVLVLLAAVSLNARIGFVAFFAFTIYIILNILLTKKSKSLFILFFVVILVFITLPYLLSSISSWALDFFYEMGALLSGRIDDSVTFSNLSNHWIFPNSILSLLLGTGESIYLTFPKRSDIGIVLQIYYGGIVFYLLLNSFILFQFLRITIKKSFFHWFGLIYIFSYLIINLKGFYFASVPGARLFGLLYVFYVYNSSYSN